MGLSPRGLACGGAARVRGMRIFVPGTLGDAALCLTGLPSPHGAYLETRLRRPTPRVAEGLTVRGLASGGIDISDGLAADLAHLLTQSGCGAMVYLERLPLSPALRALDDPDRRRALAVAGGDDYELCFTVPPQQRPMLESRWRGHR